MTSTDAREYPADPFLAATAADIEQAIAREFLKRPPETSPLLLAQIAMVIIDAVLEARDAEIGRLRAGEALARIDGAVPCARRLRDAQMRDAANLIDPFGPLQAARAAGGTA